MDVRLGRVQRFGRQHFGTIVNCGTAPGHSLLIGYGRVGSLIAAGLAEHNESFLLREARTNLVERARANGVEAMVGNAADPAVIALANVAPATRLFVDITDAFEAGQIVEQARAINGGRHRRARSFR